MVLFIEEKYEEAEIWIVQSLVKVNLMQWNTRFMAEFMHWKCFFRQMKLCDILKEFGLWRGSPTGRRKLLIAKGLN